MRQDGEIAEVVKKEATLANPWTLAKVNFLIEFEEEILRTIEVLKAKSDVSDKKAAVKTT